MARPYEGPTIRTSLRLPVWLHRRLTEEAEAREVDANLLARRAIERFLDDLIPVQNVILTYSERPDV